MIGASGIDMGGGCTYGSAAVNVNCRSADLLSGFLICCGPGEHCASSINARRKIEFSYSCRPTQWILQADLLRLSFIISCICA